MRLALASLLALAAAPLWAGPYARPLGITPPAEDLGHVFYAVCHPTKPGLLEDRIALAESAFGWVAVDLGTDAAFETPDKAITVSLDGNVLKASCTMTIAPEAGGDGAALLSDLEAHLAEDLGDKTAEQTETENGTRWAWEGSSPYVLTFSKTDEAYVIALEAGGF